MMIFRTTWLRRVAGIGAFSLAGIAGCDIAEPESQLRFSPAGLNVEVGSTGSFSGIITLGTPTGTWFVQPNSITIAQVEVTGPLTGELTCLQPGAGAFILSTLTSQGQASGSLYFVCYN